MRDYYSRFPNYNTNRAFNYQPSQEMSVQRMPSQRMPNQGMPNQRMPDQRMPNQGMPNQGMPDQRMPNQTMPNQRMPDLRMPNQRMPDQTMPNQRMPNQTMHDLSDQGPEPFSFNIREATIQNNNYRQAVWTGQHLQITLMSIDVDSDIGYETHPNVDQFIRIEQGEGLVLMGDSMDNMDYQNNVREGYAFVIPAGKWHNLINTGNRPIKLYSIYAPPEHPHGTLQQTKENAIEME